MTIVFATVSFKLWLVSVELSNCYIDFKFVVEQVNNIETESNTREIPHSGDSNILTTDV